MDMARSRRQEEWIRRRHGSHVLTDHEEIRQWAEERGAHPSCVRGTGNKRDLGVLRLDFPGYTGQDKLEEISWDEFFDKFDERGLSLLVQDTTARGQKSNFNKLVSRETASTAAAVERWRRSCAARAGVRYSLPKRGVPIPRVRARLRRQD